MTRLTAHFLHIGKTGGTAIREALSPVAIAEGIVLHDHEFALRDVPEGETAFFFLRDPATRFVSGFNSRLRRGRPRYDNAWNAEEAWAFARYPSANALAEDIGSSDAMRAMNGIGHVQTSYARWLDNTDYVLSRDILFAGRQEKLTEDFEVLKRRLGVEGAVLPVDAVRRHATPDGFDTTLSMAALSNLARWYAEDYRMIDALRSPL